MFDYPVAEEAAPLEDETEEEDAPITFDAPRPIAVDDDWNDD